MMNQKEGVFQAVVGLVGDVDGAVQLDREQKRELISILAGQLEAGDIEVSEAKRAKCTEAKHWRDYASNILNNWTRKDTRLNGGERYVAKNPGSRAGSGDDQVRELRKLKSTMTNPDHIAKVDQAIAERIAELKAEKAKASIESIDLDMIPDHLKSLVG